MRKLILILGLFSFLYLGVTDALIAQDAESRSSFYRPRIAVKFVPLPLVDYTPAAQVAVEIGTFKNQALELEYGYVFNLHKYRNPNSNFTGHKLIATYRIYLFKKEDGPKNMFFALRYMRKEVNVKGTDYVWMNDRAYQEIIDIRLQNRSNAGYLMLGYVFPLYKKFRLEAAFGTGFRDLKVRVKDIPENAEFAGDISTGIFNDVNGEGDYSYPSLILSAKVIYPLF